MEQGHQSWPTGVIGWREGRAMSKIIWMSDLHFAADGLVAGVDPRARVRAAVDHINTHYRDAEICVISGDMVNRGTVKDYTALRLELVPGDHQDLKVNIIKRRGSWPGQRCSLALGHRADITTQDSSRVVQGPWPRSQG